VRLSGVWDRNDRSVRDSVLEALVEEGLLAIGRYSISCILIDACYQLYECRAYYSLGGNELTAS
jgi:hypothetical protein